VDGEIATFLWAALNLLARMTPALALDIPAVPLVAPLPWVGSDLATFALRSAYAADPYGKFVSRPRRDCDYPLHLGRNHDGQVVHGSGWNAYLGAAPSPLPDFDSWNPVGPALASILAATEIFKIDLKGVLPGILLNALTWTVGPVTADVPGLGAEPSLGTIWAIGTGSVGTAILYFLSLATTRFSAGLFDMDTVKIHNLDRSPIFTAADIGREKVAVAESYLRGLGITDIQADPQPLDESSLWCEREAGIPDVLISAANERHVRSVIENGLPPLQIYGTTGKHWQAACLRHVPVLDPCSCCLFPETDYVDTECAKGPVTKVEGQEQVDAALPFLSFAAGLMAAAEILKLTLPDYPITSNRVIMNTQPLIRTIHAPLTRRSGCLCQCRNDEIHRTMIAGSRFAGLS